MRRSKVEVLIPSASRCLSAGVGESLDAGCLAEDFELFECGDFRRYGSLRFLGLAASAPT